MIEPGTILLMKDCLAILWRQDLTYDEILRRLWNGPTEHSFWSGFGEMTMYVCEVAARSNLSFHAVIDHVGTLYVVERYAFQPLTGDDGLSRPEKGD